MPQASDELRAYWGGADDGPALDHLKGAGFKLLRSWHWEKPSPDYKMTERDWLAINFLIDEWDFGGLVGHPEGSPEHIRQ